MKRRRLRGLAAAVAIGALAAGGLTACGDVAQGVELTLTFGPAWRTDEGARLQMVAAAAAGSRDLMLRAYRLTVFAPGGAQLASGSGALEVSVLAGGQTPFELPLLGREQQDEVAAGASLRLELVIQGETSAGDGFSQGEVAEVSLP